MANVFIALTMSGETLPLSDDGLLRGGNNLFLFNTTLNAAANVDTITDFSVAADLIGLDHAIFSALGAGNLAASAFTVGAAATTAAQHIIYNAATGALYYDPDGLGGAAQTQFATLTTGLALTHNSFAVV